MVAAFDRQAAMNRKQCERERVLRQRRDGESIKAAIARVTAAEGKRGRAGRPSLDHYRARAYALGRRSQSR